MLKYTFTSAALSALMLSSAFAQSSPTSAPNATKPITSPTTMAAPSTASEMFIHQQNAGEWRASQLIGTDVMGPNNVKIGDVNDVVVDSSGTVRAVVIGAGGFLGVGEKDIAISLKSLMIKQDPSGDKIDKLSTALTKEQLAAAPAYKWNQAAAAVRSDKRSENSTSK